MPNGAVLPPEPPRRRVVHPNTMSDEALLELLGYGPDSGRRVTPAILAEIAEIKALPPLPPVDQVGWTAWVSLAVRPKTIADLELALVASYGHGVAGMMPDVLVHLAAEDRAEYDQAQSLWWARWDGTRILVADDPAPAEAIR